MVGAACPGCSACNGISGVGIVRIGTRPHWVTEPTALKRWSLAGLAAAYEGSETMMPPSPDSVASSGFLTSVRSAALPLMVKRYCSAMRV